MSSYSIYAPIALSQDNFADFVALREKTLNKTLQPTDISSFVERHQKDFFVEVSSGKPYVQMNSEKPGQYIQKRLWVHPQAAEGDISRSAVLTMDVVPNGTDDNGKAKYSIFPRQYMVGPNTQCVVPYRMSCCDGVSALAVYKQDGALHPDLIENESYTKERFRDLFRIYGNDDGKGIAVDISGEELKHLYMHIAGVSHSCSHHKMIYTPPALRRS